MATYLENLTTARAQIAERLVAVTAENKPSYSVDGKSYSWESYVSMLTSQLERLDEAIQRSDGPFEILTQAAP